MESQSHPFVAGLFVILLATSATAIAVWLSRPESGPRLPIDLITTHSVAGLKVDAAVRLRGVDVGRVVSIAFDPQTLGQIRVRIAVDAAAPVTSATYATLSYQGIDGVALIQLDDDRGKSTQRLRLSASKVPQMELRAGLLERAESDVRDVLLKVASVAERLEGLLSQQNTQRLMALVSSLQRASDQYGTLARTLRPSAQALPGLLKDAKGTVATAQLAAARFAHLADEVDGKLAVLDETARAATQIGSAADALHRDTLPRVNSLVDEVSVDARELERTLHEVNERPQSLLFGLATRPPGPGEPGFIESEHRTQ